MNGLFLRFPHLMEQILQKLDNKSLVKSREVTRIWKKLIDQKKYPWIRIVKFPTILQGGNTYLHLAAKDNQIDTFKVILNDEANKNLVNNKGYTPFLIACLFGRVRIAELLMKTSAELKIDLTRKTNFNETAFHLACRSNVEMAEMIMTNSDLLKINLNEKAIDIFLCCETSQGMSGFHCPIACTVSNYSPPMGTL